MPREVEWSGTRHAVRYATHGNAVVITGCGRRAPTTTPNSFTSPEATTAPDQDLPTCRHPGCVEVRCEDEDPDHA